MQVSNRPLISRAELDRRIVELGEVISRDYAGRELLVLVVLKGAVFFAADLIKQLKGPVEVDFVRAKSYQGVERQGPATFSLFPEASLFGRNILIVEDILDTGHTTAALFERLRRENPASLALCALLDKPSRRQISVPCAYLGFTVPDVFVIGYGLDYNEQYRHLPDIRILEL